jgi:hypothetical protein
LLLGSILGQQVGVTQKNLTMVYEPQSPQQALQQRRTAHLQQRQQQLREQQQQQGMQQSSQHNQQNQQQQGKNGPMIGPGAMHMFRKPPVAMGDIISASVSRKNLMRQVSGLGMEDPVFRTSKDDGSPEHPSNIFDDMSFSDVPEDMRDLVSIVSDPTAARGVGLDIECYEQVLMKPYVDPNPELQLLGTSPDTGISPAPQICPDAILSGASNHNLLLSASQHKFSKHHMSVKMDPNAPPIRHTSPQQHRRVQRRLSNPATTSVSGGQQQQHHQHQAVRKSKHDSSNQTNNHNSTTMHESACTIQSLDLEGVFGTERVNGQINGGEILTVGNCKNQLIPRQSAHRQNTGPNALPSRSRRMVNSTTANVPKSSMLPAAPETDPLLYEAALAMQQQGGGNNRRLAQTVLSDSPTNGLNPSNHLRPTPSDAAHHNYSSASVSGSQRRIQQQHTNINGYSDHLQATRRVTRNGRQPNQVMAPVSQHGQPSSSRPISGSSNRPIGDSQHGSSNNSNNLDEGAIPTGSNRNYRPPPSTHNTRKKKEGTRRRSMPLMSNIFPWEEQQEGESQQQHQDENENKSQQLQVSNQVSDSENDGGNSKQQTESFSDGGGSGLNKGDNVNGVRLQSNKPSNFVGTENTSLEASTAETAQTTLSAGNTHGSNNQLVTKALTQSPGTVQSFPRSRSHSPVKRPTTTIMDIVGNSSNSSIRSNSKTKNLVINNAPSSPVGKSSARKISSALNFGVPLSPKKESAIHSSHTNTNTTVSNASTHRSSVGGFLSSAFRRSSHGGRA